MNVTSVLYLLLIKQFERRHRQNFQQVRIRIKNVALTYNIFANYIAMYRFNVHVVLQALIHWSFPKIRKKNHPYAHIARVSYQKGSYLPCVSMAGRPILAGYHREISEIDWASDKPVIQLKYAKLLLLWLLYCVPYYRSQIILRAIERVKTTSTEKRVQWYFAKVKQYLRYEHKQI